MAGKMTAFVFLALFCFPMASEGRCYIRNPTMCDSLELQRDAMLAINTTCPNSVVQLKPGETYKVATSFTRLSVTDVREAQSIIVVFAPGVTVSADGGQACDVLTCPLKTLTSYSYSTMFSLDNMPASTKTATLSWALVDSDTMQNVFCVRVAAAIEQEGSKVNDLNFEPEPLFQVVP